MSPESVTPIFNRGLVNWQVSFVLPKLHSSFHFPCRKLFSVVKPASCTTTSLFIVIFSKNSFFIAFLCLSILEEAFVLKSGCKGTMFSHTSQIYNKKTMNFTCFFAFLYRKCRDPTVYTLLYTNRNSTSSRNYTNYFFVFNSFFNRRLASGISGQSLRAFS